jgi:hypothetical protein
MAALQDFDQSLFESSTLDGDAWADDAVVLVGSVAAKLSDDDLVGLSVIWPNRPLLWQQHCAEVLGWAARQDASIELLMSLVDQADPQVALAALESLREFHPARFTAEQTKAILAALRAMLARPVGPLHQVVLGAFLATLQAAGAPG